jgi:hypothetical protein
LLKGNIRFIDLRFIAEGLLGRWLGRRGPCGRWPLCRGTRRGWTRCGGALFVFTATGLGGVVVTTATGTGWAVATADELKILGDHRQLAALTAAIFVFPLVQL